MIESDTTDDDKQSDFYDLIRELDTPEPMKRILALGRLNKSIELFRGKKLEELDRHLLKGFYVSNKRELENSSDQ